MIVMILFRRFALAACFLTLAASAEVTLRLDSCRNASAWGCGNGAEFKGAKVSLADSPEGLKLGYDFTGGGNYVTLHPGRLSVGTARSYSFTLKPEQDVSVRCRLLDADGRWFQSHARTVRGGGESVYEIPIVGKWHSAWGGRNPSAPQPKLPLRSLSLMVDRHGSLPLSGNVLVSGFSAKLDDEAAPKTFRAEPFQKSGCGWTVDGRWIEQPGGALLVITAEPQGERNALLTVTMPRPGRDAVQRYELDAKHGKQILAYRPDFIAGINPRNCYRFRLELEGDGERFAFSSQLAGLQAEAVNLGAPRSSREIGKSRFGTCVHFKYAAKPAGAFKGWYDYRRILDEIEACGFKYIRDGVGYATGSDGRYLAVDDHGKNVLREAKERGIEMILEFELRANQTVEQHLNKVEVLVRDTRDYVKIYEVGNEPHNFGEWRRKYPGSWNGYEAKDGSISRWVREHLNYTNAVTDHLKRLYPEATAIGLGACAPTNFHYLTLDVTPNLDGVVEHPYTFSMPPETVPFGWGFEKRDGIRIGDREHTFAGLVRSYKEHFKKTGRDRQLWVTEFGFTSFWFNGKVEGRQYAGFSEQAQAEYLIRRFIESLALPIEVTCQYDFIDDYDSQESGEEANFGLLRSDFSRKPAFYAVQRINSLFAGTEPDPQAKLTVTDAPLHRSMKRSELIRDWDKTKLEAANGVRLYAFRNPETPDERLIALWSMLPYSGEFNNRAVSFAAEGLETFGRQPAVGINLMTGESFDVEYNRDGGRLVFERLPLKAPMLIKLFR